MTRLGTLMANNFHELSNSQKEAIFTLIEKRDNDMRDLSNLRLITPVNVDVKLIIWVKRYC